jgi:hypothetical protein
MKTLIALSALTVLIATPTLADGVRDPGVNHRQHNQQVRIREGVKSGELTRRETHRLREEQRDVRQLERAYKSDGTLTRAERVDLHHEQNQAGRDIRRQKHDRQERR